MDTELEKLKIQKTQMYLQVVSVFLSSVLLYVLITSKKNPNVIETEFMVEED